MSSYSPVRCEILAAEALPGPYAASADQNTPVSMKRSSDQPATPNGGFFYPMYPADSYDFSSIGPGATAATGQPPPEFSATGPFDAELPFPLDSPGTAGVEGPGPQPLGPWYSRAQAYPALVGGTMAMADHMSPYIPMEESNQTYYVPRDVTVAMADSVSEYVPEEEPPGGCYDPFKWPLPMGQMSPSPSQSSYYIPSPASGGGAHSSRHNSCASLPALNTSAIEYIRSDAWLRPGHGQALSPDDARSSPAGNGPRPSRESSASAHNHIGSATTTTDYRAGIVSPAMTPSPRNTIATFADQAPRPQIARQESDQQNPSKTSRKQKVLAPAWRTATQEEQNAEGQAQQRKRQRQRQQQQQQQQQQAAPRPRNRDAANKCRAKTKQAMADLESAERAMSSEHRELSATARGLRDEVLMLKNQLLAHGNCDDSLIQQYINHQAQRVGYGAAQQAELHQQQQHQGGHEHAQ